MNSEKIFIPPSIIYHIHIGTTIRRRRVAVFPSPSCPKYGCASHPSCLYVRSLSATTCSIMSNGIRHTRYRGVRRTHFPEVLVVGVVESKGRIGGVDDETGGETRTRRELNALCPGPGDSGCRCYQHSCVRSAVCC